MQERLYLGVRNRITGDFFVVVCTLPVQIGRQADVGNQVLLDPKYGRVSRVHGMIEKTSRGYVYSDSSANGSQVDGLSVKETKVSLSSSFRIEIENYTINKVEVTPFIVLHTDERLNEQRRLELLPGRGLGVTDTPGNPQLIMLDRYDERTRPVLGHLEITDEQPVWVQRHDVDVDARRNKAKITAARTLLTSLDVLEVERHRFEILHPHEGRIVCGFERCHLLNPPPLAGNCRFCGHDLAGGGGFSRVL